MVDVNIIVRKWLLACDQLTTLIGANKIYAPLLPEKIDPAAGPVVVVSVEGGIAHSETPIQKVRVQVRVWAGVGKYELARQVYRLVFDWMHGKTNIQFGDDGTIIRALEVVSGQDVTDPDLGYSTVLGYFEMIVRDGIFTELTGSFDQGSQTKAYIDAGDAATLAAAEAYTDSHSGSGPDDDSAFELKANKDIASGYAGLDSGGKIVFSELPVATTTNIGAIKRLAAVATKFLTSIDATGLPVAAQPDFTDISGVAAVGQIPSLPESQITNLVTDLAAKEVAANKDANSGYAGLTSGGLLKAAEFPAPSSSTFGGVKSLAAVTSKFLTSIGTDGIPVAAFIADADLPVYGDYLIPGFDVGAGNVASSSVAFSSATTGRVWLIMINRRFTVTKVTIKVGTPTVGAKIGIGIFDTGKNRLIDPGPFDGNSATVQTLTLGSPFTLARGAYYLYVTCTSATPVSPYSVLNPSNVAGDMLNANVVRVGTVAVTYNGTTLPSSFTTITASGFSYPFVLFE